MNAPSLTRRAVGYLFVGQLLAFFLAWLATILLGLAGVGNFSIHYLATARASAQVVRALVLDHDGELNIRQTSELVDELLRAPAMKFAVFDSRRRKVAKGSSPEIVATLRGIIDISPEHTHFVLQGAPTEVDGLMEPRRTPYGQLHVAVYGQKFHWTDLFYAFENELRWLYIYLIAAIAMSAAVAWFAVRRGLAPLRAVAREAATIDMDSLDQRLSLDNVPREISPLVNSMNAALARLDAGAARQRRFTANAAHELRTPVAILSARLDAAEEPTFKTDLKRDARRIRNIVEQLLATAKLGEKREDSLSDFDLVTITRAIVSDAVLLAIRNGRQIAFEGPPAPILVRGDRASIESVIANLIDNALRAEPQGGAVTVRVGADGGVDVIDHGDGIPPDERELVFEPFWRKTDAKPGVGLGLAIAKEIVDRLGATIQVEETPGGGATFRLRLRASAGSRAGRGDRSA